MCKCREFVDQLAVDGGLDIDVELGHPRRCWQRGAPFKAGVTGHLGGGDLDVEMPLEARGVAEFCVVAWSS